MLRDTVREPAAMNTSPTSPPWWRPPSVWTVWDVFLVRTGGALIFFGILGHLLPLVGLQFRKLNNVGNAAPAVATGVAVVGVAMIVYVVLLKGRLLKGLLAVAALMFIAFVGLLIIGWFSSRRSFSPPAPPPAFSAPPAPGAFPPGAARTGTNFPGQPSMPPGVTPPPPMDYDSLVARFGKDRVVRLTITNAEGFDLGATIRNRFEAMPPTARPGTWRVTFSGGRGAFIAAPVTDLAAFLDALRLGDVIAMDQANHSAEIALDQSKAIRKTGSP